jgi:hypothetical protein
VNEALVREELLPKEQLLWLGQPDTGTHFGPADLWLAPLSVVLAVAAFFGEGRLLGLDQKGPWTVPVPAALGGGLLCLLSLYLLLGRFIYRAWQKRRTYYAVTTKRVLVLVDSRPKSVRGLDLAHLPAIEKRQGSSKGGSLLFGGGLAFVDLLDVEGVRQMIQKRKDKLG